MHVTRGQFLDGQGFTDFSIPGRSVPELFGARIADGTKTLNIDWTASLGRGTLVNRIKQIQDLAGGPGCFSRITGQASDEFRSLIAAGKFDVDEVTKLLGQRLGGTWKTELIPAANSVPPTWNIVITRVGG